MLSNANTKLLLPLACLLLLGSCKQETMMQYRIRLVQEMAAATGCQPVIATFYTPELSTSDMVTTPICVFSAKLLPGASEAEMPDAKVLTEPSVDPLEGTTL